MKYENKILSCSTCLFRSKQINERINWNLSLIKEYNDSLKNEDKTQKEIELIQKSIQLIEREQTFLIDLLQKAKEIENK